MYMYNHVESTCTCVSRKVSLLWCFLILPQNCQRELVEGLDTFQEKAVEEINLKTKAQVSISCTVSE